MTMEGEEPPRTDLHSREQIDRIMSRFYTAAMGDDLIGFFFTEIAMLDLDHHLPLIGDFWEDAIFGTFKYQRNPLIPHVHLHMRAPLKPEHFERWLELFRVAVDAVARGDTADLMKAKGAQIAQALKVKVPEFAALKRGLGPG